MKTTSYVVLYRVVNGDRDDGSWWEEASDLSEKDARSLAGTLQKEAKVYLLPHEIRVLRETTTRKVVLKLKTKGNKQ